jgi:hypothetical protein
VDVFILNVFEDDFVEYTIRPSGAKQEIREGSSCRKDNRNISWTGLGDIRKLLSGTGF